MAGRLIQSLFGRRGSTIAVPPTFDSEGPSAYDTFGVNEDIAAHGHSVLIRLQGLLMLALTKDQTERAQNLGIIRTCMATRKQAINNATHLLSIELDLGSLDPLPHGFDLASSSMVDEWCGIEHALADRRASAAVRSARGWVDQLEHEHTQVREAATAHAQLVLKGAAQQEEALLGNGLSSQEFEGLAAAHKSASSMKSGRNAWWEDADEDERARDELAHRASAVLKRLAQQVCWEGCQQSLQSPGARAPAALALSAHPNASVDGLEALAEIHERVREKVVPKGPGDSTIQRARIIDRKLPSVQPVNDDQAAALHFPCGHPVEEAASQHGSALGHESDGVDEPTASIVPDEVRRPLQADSVSSATVSLPFPTENPTYGRTGTASWRRMASLWLRAADAPQHCRPSAEGVAHWPTNRASGSVPPTAAASEEARLQGEEEMILTVEATRATREVLQLGALVAAVMAAMVVAAMVVAVVALAAVASVVAVMALAAAAVVAAQAKAKEMATPSTAAKALR